MGYHFDRIMGHGLCRSVGQGRGRSWGAVKHRSQGGVNGVAVGRSWGAVKHRSQGGVNGGAFTDVRVRGLDQTRLSNADNPRRHFARRGIIFAFLEHILFLHRRSRLR
jgi:hypothetical protein